MGQFDDFLPMTICRNSWVGHLFRVPCGMSLRLCAKNLTNDEEEHESRSHLTCKVENDPRPLRPKIYSFDGMERSRRPASGHVSSSDPRYYSTNTVGPCLM